MGDKPGLSAVRAGLKRVIQNAIPELYVYGTLEEITEAPAALLEPEMADFERAFNNGDHVWFVNCWVMVPRTDPAITQDALDAYVDGWGPKSIRQAIYDNPDLGLGVDAEVYGMKDYGGQFRTVGIPHLGAVLLIRVHI